MEDNSTYIKINIKLYSLNAHYGKYLFKNNYSDFWLKSSSNRFIMGKNILLEALERIRLDRCLFFTQNKNAGQCYQALRWNIFNKFTSGCFKYHKNDITRLYQLLVK